MPRVTKPLTNTEVDKSKPKEKEYNLVDGDGLALLIKPSGTKSWVFNYYRPHTKKRTKISFGKYPEVTLKQAREKDSMLKNCSRKISTPKNTKMIKYARGQRQQQTLLPMLQLVGLK